MKVIKKEKFVKIWKMFNLVKVKRKEIAQFLKFRMIKANRKYAKQLRKE